MWMLGVLMFFGGLVGVIVYLARREGQKTARLDMLKKEVREVARVQDIKHRVDAMPLADVRRRLRRRER